MKQISYVDTFLFFCPICLHCSLCTSLQIILCLEIYKSYLCTRSRSFSLEVSVYTSPFDVFSSRCECWVPSLWESRTCVVFQSSSFLSGFDPSPSGQTFHHMNCVWCLSFFVFPWVLFRLGVSTGSTVPLGLKCGRGDFFGSWVLWLLWYS